MSDNSFLEDVPMVDQLAAALRGIELGDYPSRPTGPTFEEVLFREKVEGLYCGYCQRDVCICYCPQCGRKDCARH